MTVLGTAGNDSLTGSGANDAMQGLAGNDVLSGLAGNDSLDGGAGNDSLLGGLGIDTFVFAVGSGNDIILADSSNWLDKISFTGLTTAQITVSYSGADLVLSTASGDSLTVKGWNDMAANRLNQFVFGNQTYTLSGTTFSAASLLGTEIAYLSDRGATWYQTGIYVTDSNDSHSIRLSVAGNDVWDRDIAWSPDGGQLAYVSNANGLDHIYVMATNGNEKLDLTPNMGSGSYEPAWSPGGAKLSFTQSSSYSGLDIYMINRDGSGYAENLTNSWDTSEQNSVWSPDGSKIAYTAYVNGVYSVYLRDVFSGVTTQIAILSDSYSDLSWSPDGSKLACTDLSTNSLWVVNGDGSGAQQLTTPISNVQMRNAVWSPDSTRLVYERGTADSYGLVTNWDLFIINADGTGNLQLTAVAGNDVNASWSPDGTRIAFETWRNGNADIYIINADGTNLTQITTDSGNDTNPEWQPLAGGNPFLSFHVNEGSSSNDTLSGSSGNDIIYGFEGADLVHGGEGNDTLYGGAGNDTLFGEAGNDLLFNGGDYGANVLNGGTGNDTLVVEQGSASLTGGEGNDLYIASMHDVYGKPIITSASDNSNDILQITGAMPARLWVQKNGNDLYLTNSDYSSDLYIQDWFRGGGYKLNRFRFGDAIYQINAGNEFEYVTNLTGTDEGHSTKATAQVLSGNDVINGSIAYGGDSDWYTYTPTDNGTFNLYQMSGNTSLFIDILDSSGNQVNDWRGLTSSDNLSDNFRTNAMLLAGQTYYIRIEATDPAVTGAYQLNFVRQTPTAGADALHGSAGADYIDALAGNDTIVHWYGSMFSAADTVLGGDGNDVIVMGSDGGGYFDGGNDNDAISGYMAGSTILGGAGDDTLTPYGGSEIIDGGAGNDSINTDSSYSTISGGSGNDTLAIWNGAASDTLTGGAGNDLYKISGGGYGSDVSNITFNDFAEGATDSDTLDIAQSFATNQVTFKRSISDLTMTRTGSSTVIFRIEDWFKGAAYQVENFMFHGYYLTDSNYTDYGDYSFTASQITTWAGWATQSAGTSGNDILYGNDALNDTLDGGGGDDNLYGFGGNDVLTGGAGNDVLNGGDGADRYLFSSAFGQDTIEADGTNSVDRVFFTGFTHNQIGASLSGDNLLLTVDSANTVMFQSWTLGGGNSLNQFSFEDGNYRLDGSRAWQLVVGANDVIGTENNDSLTGTGVSESIYGLGGNDTIAGLIGPGIIFGGDGSDSIFGGNGDDAIFGGNGADTLQGGAGGDLIDGGLGDDALFGGNGGGDNLYGGSGDDLLMIADISRFQALQESLRTLVAWPG